MKKLKTISKKESLEMYKNMWKTQQECLNELLSIYFDGFPYDEDTKKAIKENIEKLFNIKL